MSADGLVPVYFLQSIQQERSGRHVLGHENIDDTDAMEQVCLCPGEFDDSGKGSAGISRGDSGEGIVRLEGRRQGDAF